MPLIIPYTCLFLTPQIALLYIKEHSSRRTFCIGDMRLNSAVLFFGVSRTKTADPGSCRMQAAVIRGFFNSVLLYFLDDVRHRFEDFLSFLFPSLLRTLSAVRTLETVFGDGFSAPLADHDQLRAAVMIAME